MLRPINFYASVTVAKYQSFLSYALDNYHSVKVNILLTHSMIAIFQWKYDISVRYVHFYFVLYIVCRCIVLHFNAICFYYHKTEIKVCLLTYLLSNRQVHYHLTCIVVINGQIDHHRCESRLFRCISFRLVIWAFFKLWSLCRHICINHIMTLFSNNLRSTSL